MRLLSLVTLFSVCSISLATPSKNQVALNPEGTVHTTDSWSYVDCGLSTDIIQIESLEVSPDPPQPGKDLTVKVKAHVSQTIEEGAFADVTVKLGLIKLLQKRFDACEEARNVNATVKCPVEPGSYTVEQTVALPREIPRAKFLVKVLGFTVDEEEMLCLELKVDFMKRPFLKLW
ncbi:hypothetical protein K443DRAFT_673810 [Laccaria amethystina LaAM-08-1]|uniref:Phosphatidylglycerol/phosphatidylinositol transfer protein n=1 Tax=Laccaria amethystina LaAM-08-1 TaxID=1095629 RepID=A0A0C9Y9L8_9AGAR|nr:hypothetical protein K443DRAFT_673810 [Laccaria amethystina LaAM-08-1]